MNQVSRVNLQEALLGHTPLCPPRRAWGVMGVGGRWGTPLHSGLGTAGPRAGMGQRDRDKVWSEQLSEDRRDPGHGAEPRTSRDGGPAGELGLPHPMYQLPAEGTSPQAVPRPHPQAKPGRPHPSRHPWWGQVCSPTSSRARVPRGRPSRVQLIPEQLNSINAQFNRRPRSLIYVLSRFLRRVPFSRPGPAVTST